MSTSYKNKVLGYSALALVLAALPAQTAAWAEPTAAEASAVAAVEEIFVTAQKRSESLQKVPAAVSALSGDSLLDQNITLANGIERVVPNLIANAVTGHVQPRWYVRGIGSQDPGNLIVSPVGVYIDDVYLNSPYAAGFPLFDLERVEVLRGPQGTLWGKNTTGGAINFVSKKPSFESGGYANVEVGSYDSKKFEGAYGGALIDGKLAARVAGEYQATDGWAETAQSGKKVSELTDQAVRLSLLATPTDNLSILGSVRYRKYEGPNSPFYGLTAAKASTGKVGAIKRDSLGEELLGNYDDVEHIGGTLTIDYDLKGYSLTSITAVDDLKRDSAQSVNAFGSVIRAFSALDSTQVTQELRLASPREDRFNWIVGGHYFYEDLKSNASRAILPNVLNSQTFRNIAIDQTNESYAAFANATVNVTDRLAITGGIRYTRESKDINLQTLLNSGLPTFSNETRWWEPGSVSSPLVVSALQDQKKTWSGTTYDITPEYKISDNLFAYLRYAKGFRSGGFNGNAVTQGAVAIVNPEHVTDYEAGLKTEWLGGKLTANLAAFYYDYKNIQANVLTTGPQGLLSTLQNAGKGKAKGAELELQARPNDALHFYVNLGYLDSEYTDFNTGGAPAKGNVFANAPRYTASIGADYRIGLENGGAIIPAADFSYRSKTYFTSNAQSDEGQAQRGYGLGNIYLTYVTPSEAIRVSAYVNNVTDKSYKLLGLPYAAGFYTYVLGDPRTFGASLTANF